MKDFWRALRLSTENRKLTILTMFIVLMYTILDLMVPLVIKQFFDLIDATTKSGSTTVGKSFWVILAAFIAITLVRDGFNQGLNYFIPKWWVDTKERLTISVFSHMESLSLSYFEHNSTGKIKERIDRGINDLSNVVEGALMDVLPQVIFVIAAAYILIRINIVLGIILIAGIPLFVLISFKFMPRLRTQQDSSRDAYEKMSGRVTESIINVKTIKSYATEAKHLSRIRFDIKKAVNADMKYVVTRVIMNIYRFLIMDLTQIAMLATGVYLTLSGHITLGTLMLAWQYTNRSISPLWYLTRVLDNAQRDMRSVRRVFELLDTKPTVEDIDNAKPLSIKYGEIEFKNVGFKYEDKQIVKNLSLTIPSGKVVAFVGKSGVGKTTLVKLLMRFYDPQKGSINIDGQDVANVTQRSLRSQIGYVLQDSALFNDSVLNNIRYGSFSAKDADIFAAATVANADDFIKNLPKGYKTVVGERGVKLSGGEQQRVNIARAVLKNPPILILDEATSSLDSESEQLIQEALWKLVEGKTTLIIAHRLSTIMKADLIVVMDKGKITEVGTHKDLVAKKGIYANLFEIQSGGYLK